jgi:hypothetical protein
MKKIILFELNEVPYKIIDWYAKGNAASNLAACLRSSSQFTTHTDDSNLSPWATWPSVHRGVFDREHGISFLGQGLQQANKLYPPIWEITSKAGISTGVFGSLQSYPLPGDLTNLKFYVPDTFAPESDTVPESLRIFQELNLVMARKSARNVSRQIPLQLAAKLALQLPFIGIEPSTILDICGQLLDERKDSSKSTRRRTYQGVMGFDIFMRQLNQSKPDFSTFFTNHVAANMHRYWAATFPEDFASLGHDQSWIKMFRDEIAFAMKKADQFLGRLMNFVQQNKDYELWIASSMGQAATVSEPIETMLTMKNLSKFMSCMGLEKHEWQARTAMVPDFAVTVAAEKIEAFRANVKELFINGFRLQCDEGENGFFSMATGHVDLHNKPQFALLHNKEVAYDDLGMLCEKSQDSVTTTGYHIREGIFLIYGGEPSALDQSRKQIATTEICPLILKNFNLPVPSYMPQPNSLVHA